MLLVTGAQGQLGTALKMLLGDRAVYAGRAELDIGNEQAVKAFFAARSFDMVINCAAYTAVDRAEDEPDAARHVRVARELAVELHRVRRRRKDEQHAPPPLPFRNQ